ncbi:NAD-binding protein [Rickenella mellea]|uniref:NAD-binding protein n=1 Tax=Rickenella mellea TaxID=50990 RepID=A0A4Y7QEK7_9AGAM|nr:NAD-binding protein [Rickenella mellea]
MKVLVLGATGFLGLPVAQAFVRSGHEVWGQTRSQSKAKLLASEEIIPLIADPSNGPAWAEAAAKADVVINCIGGDDIVALTQKVYQVVAEAAKKARGASLPKLTYICTSGAWVYGDDRTNLVSERSPLNNPAALVKWRPEEETRILKSTEFDGIIVRPAMLYGRSGSITHMLFAQAAKGKIEWGGHKRGRMASIHVDDAAELFLRVAEAAPICKGVIFDASNNQTESVEDILINIVEVSGASGYSFREPDNVFEQAVATTTLIRPSLGRALLGWAPKKAGFVDGMKTYYASWQAAQ